MPLLGPPGGRSAAARQAAATTAFVNVAVIPMDSERTLRDQTVVVVGDRITEVGSQGAVSIPEGARIIEGRGAYLMPGLANMHYHVDELESTLVRAVANGQTTIQDMKGLPNDLVVAAEIAAGERFGPSMIVGWSAGGLLASQQHFVERLIRAAAPHFSLDRFLESNGVLVDAAGGGESAREAHEAGADFVKSNVFVQRSTFDGMVEVANELGMKVQGHISGKIGVEHLIQAGAHPHHFTEVAAYLSRDATQGLSLQSYDFLKIDEQLPRLVELMKQGGTWFTPTLFMGWFLGEIFRDAEAVAARPELRWAPPSFVRASNDPEQNLLFANLGPPSPEDVALAERMVEAQARMIRACRDAGVPLLAGTDSSAAPWSVQGFELPKELEFFVEYGLTPYEALGTSTPRPAEFWEQDGEWGTIEAGKRADLVLLNGSPLENVSNVRAIAGVMLRGEWLPHTTLQDMLEEIAAAYEAQASVLLEPFVSSSMGIDGVAPAGWTQLEEGVWTRSDPDADPTFFIQQSARGLATLDLVAGILEQFGGSVDALGDPVDVIELNGVEWSVWAPEAELALLVAGAEAGGRAYIVAVATTPGEIDALAETLLQPAVAALTPIE